MRQGGNLGRQAGCDDPREQDEGVPWGAPSLAGGGRGECPHRAHSLPADREPEGDAERGGDEVHRRGARLHRRGVLPERPAGGPRPDGQQADDGDGLGRPRPRTEKAWCCNLVHTRPLSLFVLDHKANVWNIDKGNFFLRGKFKWKRLRDSRNLPTESGSFGREDR